MLFYGKISVGNDLFYSRFASTFKSLFYSLFTLNNLLNLLFRNISA